MEFKILITSLKEDYVKICFYFDENMVFEQIDFKKQIIEEFVETVNIQLSFPKKIKFFDQPMYIEIYELNKEEIQLEFFRESPMLGHIKPGKMVVKKNDWFREISKIKKDFNL